MKNVLLFISLIVVNASCVQHKESIKIIGFPKEIKLKDSVAFKIARTMENPDLSHDLVYTISCISDNPFLSVSNDTVNNSCDGGIRTSNAALDPLKTYNTSVKVLPYKNKIALFIDCFKQVYTFREQKNEMKFMLKAYSNSQPQIADSVFFTF